VTDQNENIEEPTSEQSADVASTPEAQTTPAPPQAIPAEPVAAPEEAAAEPVAVAEEAPAEPVAVAEEAAAEPVAVAEEAAAEPVAVAEEAAAEPVVVDPASIAEATVEYVEVDEAPREKPAIPGADLIPDIVTDGSDFLDAEARAAAEAEAEEAAARAAAGDEDDDGIVVKPIADAAIDLAAGARYTATGKRKTGVARVILKPGTGTYLINGKSLEAFFPRETLQRVIRQPLETVGYDNRMDVIARMHGGGVSAQAGALRHGISKALLEADPNLRGELKRRGFLTRDPRPRVKERKKAGLKKARKRPQFSKR
jgi:small subunit ribosomal protein S9